MMSGLGSRWLGAYYHAALLKPAEEQLLEVIEREPTEYYAHLMLARTLERLSRAEEAGKHRRIAAALTGDDETREGGGIGGGAGRTQ